MNYGLSPVYSMCLLFKNIQVNQNEKRVILPRLIPGMNSQINRLLLFNFTHW